MIILNEIVDLKFCMICGKSVLDKKTYDKVYSKIDTQNSHIKKFIFYNYSVGGKPICINCENDLKKMFKDY